MTVAPLGPVQSLELTPRELGPVLHDAWIDFGSLHHDVSGTEFAGYLQSGGRKYRYLAMIEGSAGFELEDEARIGGTSVSDIREQDCNFVIEGNVPGRVRVLAPAGTIHLESESEPFQVRRWLRWRPIGST